MGLTIKYTIPTEIQSGTSRVVIEFIDEATNSNLYVPPNGTSVNNNESQITGDNFEIIDTDGNALPSDSYSINLNQLLHLNSRELLITISKSGNFRIRTKANFQLIGFESDRISSTSSGGVSLEGPQTSRSFNYDSVSPETSDTPSVTPPQVIPTAEVEEETDPEDNTGPEQTQFLAAITAGGGEVAEGGAVESGSELELGVSITHTTLGARLEAEYENQSRRIITDHTILVSYTWYLEGHLVPVLWGTVYAAVNEPQFGPSPIVFPLSPQFGPAPIFTQKIRIRYQSRGTVGLAIERNSARYIYEDEDGNVLTVTGPSSSITYFIPYSNLFEDVVPPTVDIVKPAQAIVSSPSITIEFHWSETMKRFPSRHVIVTAENFSGTEIIITKGDLIQFSPERYRMNLTFSKDFENLDDPFESIETGMVTIQVKARAGTDLQGARGPTEPKEVSFNYNLKLAPPGTEVGSDDGLPEPTLECITSLPDVDNYFLDKSYDGLKEGTHIQGAFSGVSDLTLIKKDSKDYLYGVMQIARGSANYDPENLNRSLSGPAGGALFQIDLDTCILEIIKAYPRYVAAARSLVEYNDQLYFYEGSHYNQIFAPNLLGITSNKETDWRHQVGRLRSFEPGNSNIKDKDPTTDYGLVWKLGGEINFPDNFIAENISIDERLYEEEMFRRHKATSAPMKVIGKRDEYPGDLYLYSGFGHLAHASDYLYKPQSEQITSNPPSILDNWILLKYGQYLEYRLPTLLTNQKKGYDILNELAKITGSYVGAYGTTIFYQPKFPRKAELEESFSKNEKGEEGKLLYEKNSREFPDSGLLLIETIKDEELIQEIIRYDTHNKTNSTFSGLERAQHMTESPDYFCPTTNPIHIYYVDYVLDMDANHFILPINDMNYRTDFNQLYNQFTLKHSTQNPPPNEESVEHYIENKESVSLNGGKELEIEVPELDERYNGWIEWLGDFYLEFYSNLHYLTNLTVVSSFHFKPGDLVLLRESKLSKIEQYRKLQVLNIAQNKEDNTTRLQLRTL